METTNRYCSGPLESEAAKGIWQETFGKQFSGNEKLESVLEQILSSARNHLNREGRNGHLSVFIRDGFRDRLSLIRSTVRELNPGEERPRAHLSRKDGNYDGKRKICYYELFDRLLPKGRRRNDDESKNSRGSTGWIFVSGCPLLLIGEFSPQAIKAQYQYLQDGAFNAKLEDYGDPKSGCVISEFSVTDVQKGETQYLGVPIILEATGIPIGVLRYTAKLCMPFLDISDFCFLADVATVISAAIRHFKLLRQISRENKLDDMASKLRETGNYHDFLEFAAKSISSNISSLYLSLKIGDRELLRLVDAYGISARVHELRDQRTPEGKRTLEDYHSGQKGATWALFKANDDPYVYENVPSDKSWRGLNMLAFYEKVFEERGIDIAGLSSKKLEKQLKRYSIKLMGCNLKPDRTSPAVGVFKVEFPSGYDEDYGEADKAFMKRCRDVLAPEVALLKSFVEGDWFDEPEDDESSDEFAKLLSTVIILKLIDQGTNPGFWAHVGSFITDHPEVQKKIGKSVIKMLHVSKGKRNEIKVYLQNLARSLPEVVGRILLEDVLTRVHQLLTA